LPRVPFGILEALGPGLGVIETVLDCGVIMAPMLRTLRGLGSRADYPQSERQEIEP